MPHTACCFISKFHLQPDRGIVHLSRIVHERRAAVTRIIGHKIHTIFQDYLFIKEYI